MCKNVVRNHNPHNLRVSKRVCSSSIGCLEDDVAKYDSTCNVKYRGGNGTVGLINDNRVPTASAQNKKLGDLWTLLAPHYHMVYMDNKVYQGIFSTQTPSS